MRARAAIQLFVRGGDVALGIGQPRGPGGSAAQRCRATTTPLRQGAGRTRKPAPRRASPYGVIHGRVSLVERLVRLDAADAGEVLTVQRAAYVTEAQAHGDLDLPPLRQPLSELAAELAHPHVLARGWRDVDGRLLAAVRARIHPDDPAIADIGRLTVVPDRQGQGLGSGLLSAVEEQLPPPVRELRLFTGERSEANLRLYTRLGYTETGRESTAAGYALVHLHKTRRPG